MAGYRQGEPGGSSRAGEFGRSLALAWAVVAAALGTACASSGAVAGRPSPFPGAPGPAWSAEAPMAPAAIQDVLASALALQGRPYRYGGADPESGFDCSGLVWYVFGAHGLALPRTTAEQYDAGRPVDDDAVAPGDLVFFSTDGPGPTHVGIALDDHTIVHAPSTGSVVRVERFDTPYWQSRLAGVRRPQPGTMVRDPAGAPSAGG